jgi:bacterioferritin
LGEDVGSDAVREFGLRLKEYVNPAGSEQERAEAAEEIKSSLAADVAEELVHAQTIAKRIKTIGGRVPGSETFQARQASLQPPANSTDVVAVIKGVIAAEDAAIAQYKKIIKLCDGVDYVTQDMCITALGDEEEHRREFMGFLREYEG